MHNDKKDYSPHAIGIYSILIICFVLAVIAFSPVGEMTIKEIWVRLFS